MEGLGSARRHAADSSEFRIPDSELEGSVELRVPSPQPSRLTPVPSDKILFPRRMLYVEAVLYVTVAAAAFGLGYLAGRGGWLPARQGRRRCAESRAGRGQGAAGPRTVRSGATRGPSSLSCPPSKSPAKRLPIAGLRPGDPPPAGDAASAALAEFGGAVTRADESGDFRFLSRPPAAIGS